MAIVLDASSLIAKLTSSESYAQQIADLTENEIVLSPDLIILEAISGLFKMNLRNLITKEFFENIFRQLQNEDIKLIPSKDLIVNMNELLGNITAYDASYVNLARMLNIPLCTSDTKLAKAASPYCQVICFA
ncbi:MAG: type II toxin-antitoxin system VapC family toxin [Candidatus Nanopelagicales bacterium]